MLELSAQIYQILRWAIKDPAIYIRLQGQLSRNTEASNQTWPKNARSKKLGLGRKCQAEKVTQPNEKVVRRQRKLSQHQLGKRGHIGSEEA
eukprot:1150896-Pelagomonas_calceolata.AAC.1